MVAKISQALLELLSNDQKKCYSGLPMPFKFFCFVFVSVFSLRGEEGCMIMKETF